MFFLSWLTARGSGMGSVCLMTTYREEDVFLVLVDGARVGDGVGVFDDYLQRRGRFSCPG